MFLNHKYLKLSKKREERWNIVGENGDLFSLFLLERLYINLSEHENNLFKTLVKIKISRTEVY